MSLPPTIAIKASPFCVAPCPSASLRLLGHFYVLADRAGRMYPNQGSDRPQTGLCGFGSRDFGGKRQRCFFSGRPLCDCLSVSHLRAIEARHPQYHPSANQLIDHSAVINLHDLLCFLPLVADCHDGELASPGIAMVRVAERRASLVRKASSPSRTPDRHS